MRRRSLSPIPARRLTEWLLLCALLAAIRLAQAQAPQLAVEYAPAQDAVFAELAARLREQRLLETIAAHVNERVRWPAPVTLSLTECHEIYAYYDLAVRRVVGCYELAALLVERFDARGLRGGLDRHLSGALTFVLYHEIAHALIDLFSLPVTGREEDAADQLAALLLLTRQGDYAGERALVSAALGLARSKDKFNNTRFGAEHALGKQRAYNLLCWVQGHDPRAPARAERWRRVPPERARGCEAEFKQLSRAWNTILRPAMKLPLP